MWFLVAFIGYFLLAVVVILDKFILTKSVSKPVVYTFYSTTVTLGGNPVFNSASKLSITRIFMNSRLHLRNCDK